MRWYLASIVLGLHTSEQAHAAAPPFQIEPTSLGFDLALTGPLIDGIYTVGVTHVGAKRTLLRRHFILSEK